MNTRRNGKKGAVLGAKEKAGGEVYVHMGKARSIKPVKIECMKCSKWFNVSELDCMEGKSLEDLEEIEFFCRNCMYEIIAELRDEVIILKACRDENVNGMNQMMENMTLANRKDHKDGHSA